MDASHASPPVVPGLYFSSTGPGNFKIYYQPGQDGGGTWFGQEYVSVIAERYRRRFATCFEWCAGPGFIGYTILDHGLCDRLVLADCHAPAVAAALQTTRDLENDIADRVLVYHCDKIAELPDGSTFDLVVGNPPHFYHPPDHPNFDRLDCDPGWTTHQEFFHNISSRLSDDSVILLQENWRGSTPDVFRPWIDAAGLTITDWWPSEKWFREGEDCQIYYLEVKKAK